MHPTYQNRRHEADPEARSRAGGYFVLGTNSKTPIQETPPVNGPVYLKCSIMRNFLESATEAELGCLFKNCQKGTSMSTALAEMVHVQPPTLVAT